MFKTIFALATALIIAATSFVATANAGGCGKRFSPSFQSQSHHSARRAQAARKRAIAKKRAAAKRRLIAKKKAAAKRRAIAQRRAAAKKARIAAAKAQQAQEQDTAEASNEPFDKPVSVSALAGADTRYNDEGNTDTTENTDNEDETDTEDTAEQTPAKTMETASNGEIGCKKYIPAAGLTITVPCTQ